MLCENLNNKIDLFYLSYKNKDKTTQMHFMQLSGPSYYELYDGDETLVFLKNIAVNLINRRCVEPTFIIDDEGFYGLDFNGNVEIYIDDENENATYSVLYDNANEYFEFIIKPSFKGDHISILTNVLHYILYSCCSNKIKIQNEFPDIKIMSSTPSQPLQNVIYTFP